MSGKPIATMTEDEFEALIRHTFRDELNRVGMRVDGSLDQDEARKDFAFLRSFRQSFSGATSKVGAAVLTILVGGFLWLFWQGAQTLWGAK